MPNNQQTIRKRLRFQVLIHIKAKATRFTGEPAQRVGAIYRFLRIADTITVVIRIRCVANTIGIGIDRFSSIIGKGVRVVTDTITV